MSEMALTPSDWSSSAVAASSPDTTTQEFVRSSAGSCVRVRSPQPDRLAAALTAGRLHAPCRRRRRRGRRTYAAQVGDLAWHAQVPLHELTEVSGSLEDAFMELTRDSVEFRAGDPA